MSDDILFGKVEALSETERFSLADFLLHLGELDKRKACERTSYASAFGYLTRHLGMAESDAARRVRAARAARKYPSILRMLTRGDLNLVGVAMLEPILTSENHESLLRKAARRSTRQIERMIADVAPLKEPPRDRVRLLPAAPISPVADPKSSPHRCDISGLPGLDLAEAPEIAPIGLTDRRVIFEFTASEEVRDRFEQARDLLRHRFPQGRMEEVIGEALRRMIEHERPAKPRQKRKERGGATSPPSRRIAKWIQDEVWRRDNGRCSFADPDGARCGQTGWLEFDHLVPWALGGRSDDPANVRLLCRTHNAAEARRLLG